MKKFFESELSLGFLAEHFSHYTPVENTSKLPNFKYKTDKLLTSLEINEDDILLILKNLIVDKAHGWDDLSIRIIKICSTSLTLPLELIFNSMPQKSVFPEDWKKNNAVPIHKKESKNLIKNYRPVSLLPILSKVFQTFQSF